MGLLVVGFPLFHTLIQLTCLLRERNNTDIRRRPRMSLPLAPPTKMALHHPHHHENDEPSSSAGNDQDEDDLPAAAALADILQDPNTKLSEDIRAALKADGRGSNVDREGTKIVGANTNAGMLSTLIIPRRGRRRGGGSPSEDDKRTASLHHKENRDGQGGEDDIKSHGEEEDTNSNIEMALAASMPQHKGRRTSRSFTSRGPSASFKSKLKFVVEDVESDVNGKLIKRRSGVANDFSNNNSISTFSGSINIMDFGVSFRRNSVLSLDSSQSSVDSITSSCVDSDGFLPWRRHESEDDASSSSLLYTHLPRGSNSDAALNKSNRSDSSLSNLVDSSGFLGWGERGRHCGFAGDEKGCGKRDDDVADGPSQGESGETWRIEDYEGNNDYVKRPGYGRMPFAKIKLPTFLKPGAKSQRPTPVNGPGDKSIKNIRLKQERCSTFNEAMLSSAGNRARENAGAAAGVNRRKSAFVALFGKSRKDSYIPTSSELDDDYYSGPSIHLNRENGVDIGELRRELKLAMRDLRNSP